MTGERFDIDRVRLRQYRSIKSCDVKLGPFTVLVGPNGSGKSNMVDGLRFVAQALNESLDHALRDRGGVAEVRRRSTGHPNHFEIRLNGHTDNWAAEYSFRVGARAGGEYAVTHEDCRITPAAMGGEAAYFSVREGEVISSSLPTMPRVLADRLTLLAVSGDSMFRPVVDGLAGINVFSLNPEQMRQPQKPDTGELLSRDGSNIASVIETARRAFPAELHVIESYLRTIVPGVVSVARKDLGAWESLTLKQQVAGADAPWTFPASSMSDGTLRALGVLVALFGSDPGSPSPVVIEEPETALHPAAAGILLEALFDASNRRQVLVTSHSPDLLDSSQLLAEHILAVRADSGTTVVERVDGAGADALRERLFTAGELLRSDQLIPASAAGSEQAVLF